MSESRVTVDPVVCALAVESPVRFVRVDGFIAAAKFFGDVIDNRLCLLGQHRFEANQRSWCERNSEQFFNRLRDFAIADSNDIPQVDGRAPRFFSSVVDAAAEATAASAVSPEFCFC